MWDDKKNLVRPFVAAVSITETEETPEGDWLVRGPVGAVDQKDYDGETLTKASLWEGLKMFFNLKKHVDTEHMFESTKDHSWIIGKGTEVENRNGVPWLVTKLFKDNPKAQSVWKLLKSGGEMGYSISGYAHKRDAKDRTKILGTEIHGITISARPKGFGGVFLETVPSLGAVAKALVSESEADSPSELWIEPETVEAQLRRIEAQLAVLTKAMTTGSGIVQEGAQGGQALREQTIDGDQERKCARCKRPLKKGTKSKHCFKCAAEMHSATYDSPLAKGGAFAKAVTRTLEAMHG